MDTFVCIAVLPMSVYCNKWYFSLITVNIWIIVGMFLGVLLVFDLSACLYVCLSTCVSDCMSVFMFVSLSIFLFACLSVRMRVYKSVRLYVCRCQMYTFIIYGHLHFLLVWPRPECVLYSHCLCMHMVQLSHYDDNEV